MSDNKTESEQPSAPAPQPAGLSRRDFLRRAGREAAETGAKVVPGAALATTVLGDVKTGKPNLAQRIADWRAKRNQPEAGQQPKEEGADAS